MGTHLVDPPVSTSDQEAEAEAKALRAIAAQISAAYPWASHDHLTALLRANYAATANARVQNYRLVLAERDTRALLRREANGLSTAPLARSA